MSRIALFTQLQHSLGPKQAQAVAEYVEDSRQQQLDGLATKEDLRGVRQELKEVELSLIQQIANSEKNLEEKIHNVELRLLSKMQQWSVIQLVTTIAVIIALSKFL